MTSQFRNLGHEEADGCSRLNGEPPCKQRSVIVVSPDVKTQSDYAELLSGEGYCVISASSEETALVWMVRCSPILLIVDCFTSGFNGVNLIRKIRSDAAGVEPDILAVTNDESTAIIEDCVNLGVVELIRRPLSRPEHQFRVRNQLKRLEVKLRDRQRLLPLEAISTIQRDAVVVVDREGRILFWNQAAVQMFGWAEDEAMGQVLCNLIVPTQHLEKYLRVFAPPFSREGVWSQGAKMELLVLRRGAQEFPVELSWSVARLHGALCAVGNFSELFEPQRAEAGFRDQISEPRTLLENLTAGVIIVDAETQLIEQLNPAAAALLGAGADDVRGRPYIELRRPSKNCPCPDPDLGEECTYNEQEFLCADGARRSVLRTVKGIELGGRRKLLETFVDLSEQSQKDGLYRAMFEHSFDAVMTIHAETQRYTSANPACLELFGVSVENQFILRYPWDFSPELQPSKKSSREECARLLAQALREGHVAFDWVHKRLDGRCFEASVLLVRMQHGGTTLIQSIVRDVSEQRRVARQLDEERRSCERMEMEIRASQKLESIGQLAAGIAHEINTPTQFANDSVHFLKDALEAQLIMLEKCKQARSRWLSGDNAQMLAKELDEAEAELDLEYVREQGPAAVRSAIEGLSRIATIVRAMKDFSHPDTDEKCAADINAALRNTLTIARNEYKYVAEVQSEYGAIPEVCCHPGALNQVFLNLIVNAAHAISEKVGSSGTLGRICVRTSVEGDSVRIDVTDSGPGIPESVRERIFEPFFTTKEVGRGTGQGLAIARAIVCGRHGGTIVFETQVGVGTTFTVRIPIDGRVS